MVPVLLVLLAFGAFAQVQQPSSSGGAGAGGDGAINDGVSSAIKATVKDYTNANPLTTIIVDTNGDPASLGGGSQYAEGATQATPTGTVALGKDSGNILRSILVDTNRNLLVGINLALPTGANTIGGVNLSQYTPVSGRLPVDGSGVTQPVSGTVTANLAAGTNNIGDVDVLTLPSVTVGTFPDNEPFNVAQINGVAPLMGNGATGTGSQRVTIASDNTAFGVNLAQYTPVAGRLPVDGSGVTQPVSGTVTANLAAGTNNIGDVDVLTFPDNEPFNIAQYNGATVGAGNPVHITCVSGCGGAAAFDDNATFTAGTTDISNIGGVYNDGLADVTSGNAAAPRITKDRAIHTNLRDNDGAEVGITAAPLRVDPTGTTTQPVSGTVTANAGTGTFNIQANASVNLAQIAATTTLTGNGVTGAGSQRVTIASDNTAFGVNLAQYTPVSGRLPVDGSGVTQPVSGTITVGTFPDNEPINVAQMNGVAVTMGNGTAGTGVQRNTIASDNTAIANWGQGATGAAPPTGATQIGGVTSGATGGFLAAPTVCTEYANISQTTGTQIITGVSGRRIYICALNILTATAQNVAVVAGTGSVCATSPVAVPGTSGGSTAATGWNFAANGGIVIGAGIGAIAKTTVDANNLCVLQSGSGQLSGGISYAIY